MGAVASTYIRVADEDEAMKADSRPLSPDRHKSGINGNLGKFYGYVFELHDLGDGGCEEKEDLVVMTKTKTKTNAKARVKQAKATCPLMIPVPYPGDDEDHIDMCTPIAVLAVNCSATTHQELQTFLDNTPMPRVMRYIVSHGPFDCLDLWIPAPTTGSNSPCPDFGGAQPLVWHSSMTRDESLKEFLTRSQDPSFNSAQDFIGRVICSLAPLLVHPIYALGTQFARAALLPIRCRVA